MATVDPNEHDVFSIKQRFAAVINRYEIALAQTPDAPFCFVEQKRFKLKEDIRFYADDTKSEELWRIVARQRFDPAARYDVTTPSGEKLGEIQKVFGQSLLRSTYKIYAGTHEVTVTERSLGVAIGRRLVDFIPYVGDLGNWLPIPYDFTFTREDGKLLGSHTRTRMKLRDTYTLDLSADTEHSLDRRLALALAVGLDALQAR
jgi:uncharacterized protein YxjI